MPGYTQKAPQNPYSCRARTHTQYIGVYTHIYIYIYIYIYKAVTNQIYLYIFRARAHKVASRG